MRKTALDAISFKRIPAHDTVARDAIIPPNYTEDDEEAKDAADYGTPEGARKRRTGGGASAEQSSAPARMPMPGSAVTGHKNYGKSYTPKPSRMPMPGSAVPGHKNYGKFYKA